MQISITTHNDSTTREMENAIFSMGQSLKYSQYTSLRITDMPPPKAFVLDDSVAILIGSFNHFMAESTFVYAEHH